jgi:hypothetical protein
MSRVYRPADPGHIFKTRAEIEEHLLSKVSGNAGGKIGTELELFVTTPEGLPITFDQVEMVLERIAAQFPGAKQAAEKGRIVALDIPGIGDVSLEPGAQVELSTKPVKTLAELELLNRVLRNALETAARELDLRVEGAGHKPAFLKAEDTPRSRFAAYREYLRGVHGVEKADNLVATMKSVTGLQVNVDPMGADFHEIYRALLLTDVAHALRDRTVRQKRLHDTYAVLVPAQLTPVFESLGANTNEGVMSHIVDRLLALKVPFIPDNSEEGFKSTASAYAYGFTPTVGELLEKGDLTTQILDNSLSLQLTMPNLRRHGVLETRAPDSPNTIEALMGIARVYEKFAYDAKARRGLLDSFGGIDPQLLKAAFLERFDDKNLLSRDIGGGKTVSGLIAAVEGRKDAQPKPGAATRPAGPSAQAGR